MAVIHAFQMALVPLPSLLRSMGGSHSPSPPPMPEVSAQVVSVGLELAQVGVRASVYMPSMVPREYARDRSESSLAKSNTPEAVLREGHWSGGESQKRCIP